jgi:hypothetical protein
MESSEYFETIMAGPHNHEADINAQRIANFIDGCFPPFSAGVFALENMIVIYGSQRRDADTEFEGMAIWWATERTKYEGLPVAGRYSGENIWTVVIEDTGCTYDLLTETKKILDKFLKSYAEWIALPGNIELVKEECRGRSPKERM